MEEHIHESNLIEGIDYPEEDKQSMRAWNDLKNKKIIKSADICYLQKVITLNQLVGPDKGYFRDLTRTNVTVGGYQAPAYEMVGSLMFNWVVDIWMNTPIENHIEFEKIHPFVDGNGRTGRMLMWWQEIQSGKKPTLFKHSERQDYYKLFKELKE